MEGSLSGYFYNMAKGRLKHGSLTRDDSFNDDYGDSDEIVLSPSSGKKLMVVAFAVGMAEAGDVTLSFVEDDTSTTESTVIAGPVYFSAYRQYQFSDISDAPITGGVDEPIKFKVDTASKSATVTVHALEMEA